MHFKLFHLISVLIAFASLQVIDSHSLDYSEFNQVYSFSVSSIWNQNSLREVESKVNKVKNLIAHSFIPLIVISESIPLTENFDFYLSLHNLIRKNTFFLLI